MSLGVMRRRSRARGEARGDEDASPVWPTRGQTSIGAVARHGVCRRVGSRAGETDERFGAHAELPASGLEDGGAEGGGLAGRARARDARQHLALSWQATGALWRGTDVELEIGETLVGGPRARGCRASGLAGEFAVSRGVRCSRASREAKNIVKHAWEQADECALSAPRSSHWFFIVAASRWSQRLLRCRPAFPPLPGAPRRAGSPGDARAAVPRRPGRRVCRRRRPGGG